MKKQLSEYQFWGPSRSKWAVEIDSISLRIDDLLTSIEHTIRDSL